MNISTLVLTVLICGAIIKSFPKGKRLAKAGRPEGPDRNNGMPFGKKFRGTIKREE